MTAKIDAGRDLDREIGLESSLPTGFLSAMAGVTPDSLWKRRSVLSDGRRRRSAASRGTLVAASDEHARRQRSAPVDRM
jgi:hypothetical protein